MGKPTEQELQLALETAKRMREEGQDPQHLAKTLLNHHYRLGLLEDVYHAVEQYLHSGQAEREHMRLLKTLEKVRAAQDRMTGDGHTDIGLS